MDKDELERSSRELHLSQAHLAGIIDTAAAVILTVDRLQKSVLANQSAAQVFGIARDELVGAPLEQLIPHRFRGSHARDVRAFAAGNGEARPMGLLRDVTALRANGEEFPVDASISLLRSGEREWYTVVLQDITERQRSEAALLATTSKLKAALSSMNDAVYIVDSDGHPRDLNQAFATFHRFASRAECLQAFARHPDLIELSDLDGKPVQPDQWVVPRALRGETASNVEFRLRRKDSGETWIGSYNFAPIRAADGAVVGAVAIGRDITEIRAAQAELERSRAELRLLIAAQDRVQEQERKRIARELHDDLQQTLAAIRMDASEVRDRLADKPDGVAPLLAELDRLATAAIVSVRRIVNDLRPEMLEELGLVAALTTLSGQFAERTGTTCTVLAPEDVGLLVNNEPAMATCLYRVTQEALNNAAKHARATSVHVSLAQVEPSLIRLRISDDGVGMVQGAARAAQSFGLLGMAERVRAMGAHLRIEGNHDGGTTIEVLVPIRGKPS
jgi:PAS domain S-box-containing protein